LVAELNAGEDVFSASIAALENPPGFLGSGN
jgi:hypothetical protein